MIEQIKKSDKQKPKIQLSDIEKKNDNGYLFQLDNILFTQKKDIFFFE